MTKQFLTNVSIMIHNTEGKLMNNVYTENLNDIITFDRERAKTIKLLQAWGEQGLPSDFYKGGIRVERNRNSGYVFLVNDKYQCAMMNGDKLESFYSSPHDGHEGFINELFEEYLKNKDSWHIEDAEWLLEIKSNLE